MLDEKLKEEKYNYLESGKGQTMILLHGIMGGLSNFQFVVEHFKDKGYNLVVPEIPILTSPLLKTNVHSLTTYLEGFIEEKGFENPILLGNSVGGHIALQYAKLFPEKVKALILTGSSGLYEKAMGNGYPKRGDYEYIKKRTQDVFYNPEIATKEIVDEVFAVANDRNKLIRTLSLAKSAIRHNMSMDLPYIAIRTCIIWGKNDTVTPPNVALEFNELMSLSELFWIEDCGHVPMMEHPNSFNTILETWLEKQQF